MYEDKPFISRHNSTVIPYYNDTSSSVMQGWTTDLSLREQGVLLTSVRGPDAIERSDTSKYVVRFMRCCFLNSHCGDHTKAQTFFYAPNTVGELSSHIRAFYSSFDHLPLHFITHIIHAAEILGYRHPDEVISTIWKEFYFQMCKKLHLEPENYYSMITRLQADEDTFAKNQ